MCIFRNIEICVSLKQAMWNGMYNVCVSETNMKIIDAAKTK